MPVAGLFFYTLENFRIRRANPRLKRSAHAPLEVNSESTMYTNMHVHEIYTAQTI